MKKKIKKWKTKKRNHHWVPHATTNTLTFHFLYRRPCHPNIALYRNRLASALLAPLWQSGCVWSELREADSTTRQCEGYSWASARSFDTGVFVSLLVYFSICVLLYLCICTTQQSGTVGYSYGSAESFDILRFSIPQCISPLDLQIVIMMMIQCLACFSLFFLYRSWHYYESVLFLGFLVLSDF